MPKNVDHAARRREVTVVAASLVTAAGRSALTVRNVAAATGYSTTVVSHYFDDIADLLHEVNEFAASRARTRIELVLACDASDLQGLIEAVLPLDRERRDDWRIWFAFWNEALSVPTFAAEQRSRARMTTKRIRTCLRRLAADDRLSQSVDVALTADRLSALIPGIASSAIFDPVHWTASRQRASLRDELRSLGVIETPATESPDRATRGRSGARPGHSASRR